MSYTTKAVLRISFYTVIIAVILILTGPSPSQSNIVSDDPSQAPSSQNTEVEKKNETGLTKTQKSTSIQAELQPSVTRSDDKTSAVYLQKQISDPNSFLGNLLNSISALSRDSGSRSKALIASFPLVPADLHRVFKKLSPHRTTKGALGHVLLVILFICLGLAAERISRYLFTKYYYDFDKSSTIVSEITGQNLRNLEKLASILVKMAPDTIGLFVFAVIAYLTYVSLIWTSTPFLQQFFLATLLTICLIKLLAICSNIVFSTATPEFRILPMNCNTAKTLYRLVVWVGGYVVIVLMTIEVVYQLGAQQNTIYVVRFFLASFTLLVTGIGILIYRNQIKEHILNSSGEMPSWGRKRFAHIWHLLAIIYLFILWFLVLNTTIKTVDTAPVHMSPHAFLASFFIVPIWLVADRIVEWITGYLSKNLKIYDPNPPDDLTDDEEDDREKGRAFYLKCRTAVRLTLIFAFAVWLATLWGMSLPFLSRFATLVFDAAVIVSVALVFWQFISSWIETKIIESLPEEAEEDDQDDEWGSVAKRGRSYTLLPMIRKFIASVLIVMVTMTLLSSLGVHIGPLLAGAGVVGLAIGFGAQKLVADIFSGFFYLLDDAFRVGEYIEAGNVSGAVEDITLRNVMLRHHRGMLQIVPHSDLGSITNFMRGGIVVKFNLDFPYDADIDQIRKIIKKVGQAMLEDEELGKDFIRPVKSQGVREISNSVMTIRVKFTAQPGSHFVIRREAFKRITEALQAKGIHYAHRKVIVDLPPPVNSSTSDQQIQAAGAAAMQQVEETEKAKSGRQK